MVDLHQRCWDIRWRLMMSSMYHQKRERFLDGLDRFAKFLSAIGGAAAFAQIKADPELSMWFAGSIALISTLSLTYGPAAKARRHAELARDYKRLEAELVECGNDFDDAKLSGFDAKLLRLEASEPATLGALVTQCHNELSVAFDHAAKVTPLPWWQRPLKNVFDFDQSLGNMTPPTKPDQA
ncbi:MAG: hypothetical protein Q8N06_06745 [Hydrogenophaga sp.]|jgi:hypothetical protein|nr:hypothetical protein [Hydrogenophaga sp.]